MYVGAFQKSHVHLNYISFILYSSARTYDVLLLEMGPINFVQMTGIETWTQSLWLIRTSGVPLDRLSWSLMLILEPTRLKIDGMDVNSFIVVGEAPVKRVIYILWGLG